MTISIETNVIVSLWWKDHASNAVAAALLDRAQRQGSLIVCGAVYAELVADPKQNPESLGAFLNDSRIAVEWQFNEEDWREAGRACRGYVRRRWASSGGFSRRILADFVIGAHAQVRGYSLLTTDEKHYQAAFPKLKIFAN
jgi:predicted nucleic acid-binding protein